MRHEIILQKMIGYIDKILAYTCGCTYESFAENTQLVDACVFNLSQIGELAGKLDAAYMQAHPDIPWRQMRGLRNKIVHDYEGVNLTLVWEIIDADLQQLRTDLLTLL
ncbi:MAG: DUF86 domain-containing protein [Clostridia bacterium]|nr:DUF86 domain-containing protein [Clostridia bacterium]